LHEALCDLEWKVDATSEKRRTPSGGNDRIERSRRAGSVKRSHNKKLGSSDQAWAPPRGKTQVKKLKSKARKSSPTFGGK